MALAKIQVRSWLSLKARTLAEPDRVASALISASTSDLEMFAATLTPTAELEPVAKALALVSFLPYSVALTVRPPIPSSRSCSFCSSVFSFPSLVGLGVLITVPSAIRAMMSLSSMFRLSATSVPASLMDATPSNGSVPAVEKFCSSCLE